MIHVVNFSFVIAGLQAVKVARRAVKEYQEHLSFLAAEERELSNTAHMDDPYYERP